MASWRSRLRTWTELTRGLTKVREEKRITERSKEAQGETKRDKEGQRETEKNREVKR